MPQFYFANNRLPPRSRDFIGFFVTLQWPAMALQSRTFSRRWSKRWNSNLPFFNIVKICRYAAHSLQNPRIFPHFHRISRLFSQTEFSHILKPLVHKGSRYSMDIISIFSWLYTSRQWLYTSRIYANVAVIAYISQLLQHPINLTPKKGTFQVPIWSIRSSKQIASTKIKKCWSNFESQMIFTTIGKI